MTFRVYDIAAHEMRQAEARWVRDEAVAQLRQEKERERRRRRNVRLLCVGAFIVGFLVASAI